MMIFRQLLSVCALLAVAACGGGGGNTTPFGGDAGGGGGGGGTVQTATISLTVAPSTVTAASPGTVSAVLKTASGAPIPGQVVQFSTTSGLGKFSSTSALTNADGVAVVTVTPLNTTTAGADSVVAATTYNGASVTASKGFQLTATDVSITNFTAEVGNTPLSPYGQTTLTVTLSAGSAGNPTNVTVLSSCVTRNLATLTPASVTTSTGTATFTFRDSGCGADLRDTLQASVTGTTSSRSLTLNLTPPTVASITFVSATPDTIFLRGSGFVENSTITFRVQDAAGNGVRGQVVSLEPTTLAGGLRLEDLGNQSDFPIQRVTDSNGNILVRVNSGTVPTPVRIRASMTVGGNSISTVSSTLAIAVGLPSQLNFSLSQGTRNIEGYNVDGTSNTYTIIASDRLGNPVPDGTAINFVTEGGQVQAIRFTQTTAGLSRAVANFQTSSPRPADGRVTVLSYALGEESFLDANGDNIFTAGEQFQDLGDPYLDRYLNGFFGSADNQFIPQTPPSFANCVAAVSPLLAADASIPIRPGTCSQSWGRSYVRRSIETVFSTSGSRPTWGTSWPTSAVGSSTSCVAIDLIQPNFLGSPAYDPLGMPKTASYKLFGTAGLYFLSKVGVLTFFASDQNPVAFNPMAAGTTITASGTDGLGVTVTGGSPVASSSAPTGVSLNYSFADTAFTGTITVSFRSPSGLTTSVSQFVSRETAPNPPPPPACQ